MSLKTETKQDWEVIHNIDGSPPSKFQKGGKIESPKIIRLMLEAKRHNPDISKEALNYLVLGMKEGMRG
jgi:hypothetical protein